MRWLIDGCLVAFVFLSALPASGHGVPTVIAFDAEANALTAPSRGGIVTFFDLDAEADDPGFGFGRQNTAPPIDTRLGIETTGGLLYWDGDAIEPTAAAFTIEAPEFDYLNHPNTTAVDEYVVTHGSGSQTGMTWSAYPGGDFWHADGYYTLVSTEGPLLSGVYGVPIRMVTMAGGTQLAPTDPFLMPLLYDPFGEWTTSAALAGIEAIEAALEAALTTPGDFNADGAVDALDEAVWRTQYGSPGPAADANADGVVNAADYTVWRDAASPNAAAGGGSLAIPEPTSVGLAVFALLASLSPRLR